MFKQFLRAVMSAFALYPRCYWCDFPTPDCVCPLARHNLTTTDFKPANDNTKHYKTKVKYVRLCV